MPENGTNVTIGVPELYKMIQKIDTKIELSDKENRERDEANQKEIRGWIMGNGKKGIKDRLAILETKVVIALSLAILIAGKVLVEFLT